MPVQNIVFDIGNVFIVWAPLESLKICFPDQSPKDLWKRMRPAWLDLNRGKITIEALLDDYETIGLTKEKSRLFCEQIMSQVTFLSDTFALQERLIKAGIPLYFLSDNIKEVIAYYREHFTFMQKFEGGIISADVGLLKPELAIYQLLLETYKLDPATCVFFDDVDINVEGAQKAGMTSFIFTTADACEKDLKSLGFNF